MKKLLVLLGIIMSCNAWAQIDTVKNIFVFVGENESYQQVIGTAPYITKMANAWSNFTNDYAI